MDVYIILRDYLDRNGEWNTDILTVFDNEQEAILYKKDKEKRLEEKIQFYKSIGNSIREELCCNESYCIIHRPVLHKMEA